MHADSPKVWAIKYVDVLLANDVILVNNELIHLNIGIFKIRVLWKTNRKKKQNYMSLHLGSCLTFLMFQIEIFLILILFVQNVTITRFLIFLFLN